MIGQPTPREQQANDIIRAIRNERARRRAGKLAAIFHIEGHGRYTWDNLRKGPYAGYDTTVQLASVDVLGLMLDLGYYAERPGAEAKLLTEADRELKALTSEREYEVVGPHLQMLVATVHRIVVDMFDNGDLKRVLIDERKC